MDTIGILSLLNKAVPKHNILLDEPMSAHTSFRIGGKAKYFVMPSTPQEVTDVIDILKKEGQNYVVIGNGSNLLVSDRGFDGTVVCIGKNMSSMTVEGCEITAMAGALLSTVASFAQKNSLAGFEFASGIPGSLGGAIVMNAGAYGGEMKDVVVETQYISGDGSIRVATGDMHGFGYRKSAFTSEDVILSSKICLREGSVDEISALVRELNAKRREKQPLDYPSAGSTFKRPEGYFAAKLIDDAGLRGFRVGGAMVSEKHCGFVINYENAASDDVVNLMREIKRIVFEKFGVNLEPEIRFVGDFGDNFHL